MAGANGGWPAPPTLQVASNLLRSISPTASTIRWMMSSSSSHSIMSTGSRKRCRRSGVRKKWAIDPHLGSMAPRESRPPPQRHYLLMPMGHKFAVRYGNRLSSVSSPILACNVFTSTAGAVAPPEAPNTSAAPPTSCAFQAVIWFGCTSNCCAKSASVFSPLRAANATFALTAGLWGRRIRFVMLAPDPRHHRRFQADPPLIALSEFGQPPLVHLDLRAVRLQPVPHQ